MGIDDDFVTLTSAQTRAMRKEIDEVVARYRTAGSHDPDARRLSISRVIHPLDPDRTPTETER